MGRPATTYTHLVYFAVLPYRVNSFRIGTRPFRDTSFARLYERLETSSLFVERSDKLKEEEQIFPSLARNNVELRLSIALRNVSPCISPARVCSEIFRLTDSRPGVK